MKLEDIKVGMKVKLLGKHALNIYGDIEDWYKACNYWEEVQQIQKQGFGVVTDIGEYGEVFVSDCVGNAHWRFLSSDLEPYDEEVINKNNELNNIQYEGEVVWERKEEIKKMTLEEIEKELGYKIEIVSE